MNRRKFITLLGGAAAAWPLAARARQADRVRRIGMLFAAPDTVGAFDAVVREALARLGWIEGRNVRIELRHDSDPERLRIYADELVRLAPDVIFTSGNVAARAVQMRTQTIPIVFVGAGALAEGNTAVRNIAHPEKNLTGFANKDEGIEGKWMQLLKEMAPRLTRVNFIYADWAGFGPTWRGTWGPFGFLALPVVAGRLQQPYSTGRPIYLVRYQEREADVVGVSPNGEPIVMRLRCDTNGVVTVTSNPTVISRSGPYLPAR
jgi:hypothetical protein